MLDAHLDANLLLHHVLQSDLERNNDPKYHIRYMVILERLTVAFRERTMWMVADHPNPADIDRLIARSHEVIDHGLNSYRARCRKEIVERNEKKAKEAEQSKRAARRHQLRQEVDGHSIFDSGNHDADKKQDSDADTAPVAIHAIPQCQEDPGLKRDLLAQFEAVKTEAASEQSKKEHAAPLSKSCTLRVQGHQQDQTVESKTEGITVQGPVSPNPFVTSFSERSNHFDDVFRNNSRSLNRRRPITRSQSEGLPVGRGLGNAYLSFRPHDMSRTFQSRLQKQQQTLVQDSTDINSFMTPPKQTSPVHARPIETDDSPTDNGAARMVTQHLRNQKTPGDQDTDNQGTPMSQRMDVE